MDPTAAIATAAVAAATSTAVAEVVPDKRAPCFLLCPVAPNRELYKDIDVPGGENGDSGTDLPFGGDCAIRCCAASGGLPDIIDLKVRARCVRDGKFVGFLVAPRSSIGKTPLSLANSEGIIDRGFTGSLRVAVRNHGNEPFAVVRGTSLFQLVLPDLEPACVVVVPPDHPAFAPGATVRGDGGFGSTGPRGTQK